MLATFSDMLHNTLVISLSAIDELVREACVALAQQKYGVSATVKIVPTPPRFQARVLLADAAMEQEGRAAVEAQGADPRQALDALLALLKPRVASPTEDGC